MREKQLLVNLIFDPEYRGYVADVPQLPESPQTCTYSVVEARSGNRAALLTETFEVQSDGLADKTKGLFASLSHHSTAW